MLAAKRQCTNAMYLNSARFQSLLLSDQRFDHIVALNFAKECNFNMDNSFSFQTPHSLFEYWVKLNRFITKNHSLDSNVITELFDILMKTNAHKVKISTNLYKLANSFDYCSETTFRCLVSRCDIFGIDGALLYLACCTSGTNTHQIFGQCADLTFQDKNCYFLFNEIIPGRQNILARIVQKNDINFLQKLLEYIPIVELDFVISFDCPWISLEQLIQTEIPKCHIQIHAIVKCARDLFECYRMERQDFILKEYSFLSKDICNLINQFGERPH